MLETISSLPLLLRLLFLSPMVVLLQSFSPPLFSSSIFVIPPPQFPSLPHFKWLACGYVVVEVDGWRSVAVLQGLWRNPSVTECVVVSGQTLQTSLLRWRYIVMYSRWQRGGQGVILPHQPRSWCLAWYWCGLDFMENGGFSGRNDTWHVYNAYKKKSSVKSCQIP